MKKAPPHITVFEFSTLKLGQEFPDGSFTIELLEALQAYYGNQGVPYFDLIHKGVRFKEFVGVLQVGSTCIEVLPKADKKQEENGLTKWKIILIDMLQAVYGFQVYSSSSSALKLKPNAILELYFELFIKEVEYLLHQGLIKKYHKQEGNRNSLKGALVFGKHVQQNLVHQERFYVRHTVYDVDHELHQILYKAIKLLIQINTQAGLHSRIGSLMLNFPEQADIKVTQATFDRLVYNRKNQRYQKAIEIAEMLLLRFHPDLSKGRNHVLALMFDMNLLWEQFVAVSLRKHLSLKVSPQSTKYFWQPQDGSRRTLRPDILIEINPDSCVVLDTKWKNVSDKPAMEDIRQMYAYHHYFKAKKAALVFPGDSPSIEGNFIDIENQKGNSGLSCGLIFIDVDPNVKTWMQNIASQISHWARLNLNGI